jgi:hypothetical protein
MYHLIHEETEQMATDSKLTWKTLDLDTVQPAIVAAHKAAKAKYLEYVALKKAFEEAVIKASGLPSTHTLRFGYRFGGCSVAVDVADAPKKAKGTLSLAEIVKAA